jgi:Putative secretion activating protein
MPIFDLSMIFVLSVDSGYINDANDPGGETRYGICKRDHPKEDIRNLSIGRAKEIYHSDYWIPAGCDKLEWPLCLVQFDTAVSMGVETANRYLKNLLSRYDSKDRQPSQYIKMREGYCNSLPQGLTAKYLHGWLNRLKKLQEYIDTHKRGMDARATQ